jgi:syntaxin 8
VDNPPAPASPTFEPAEEMVFQRQMMDGQRSDSDISYLIAVLKIFYLALAEQDTHLESLSHSIRRQREISENIGSELDVHTGLLEDLELGLDRTAVRLGGARRRLETVSRGARDNCA